MTSKTYQNQRHKIRTLCTLDSEDIDLSDIKLVSLSKPKKKSLNNKRYSVMNHSKIKKIQSSQFDKQTHSHSVSKTPKNINHKNERLKTQYNRGSKNYDDFDGLQSRIWKQIKSKLTNNFDKEYPVKSYQILQIISQTDNQTKYQARSLENYNLLIVRKSKARQAKQCFLKEIQMKKQIQKVPSIYRKNLTKLKLFEKGSKQWSLVYSYYGINLDWDNLAHMQLMKKSSRNNYQILKHIIKEIAKAILGLSKLGYVHGSIGNQSVFYLLEEQNKIIKLEKSIKVGNFEHSFILGEKKKEILSLKRDFTTPPQILNYIMFQEGSEGFDRDYLQFLSSYHEPWKIDIWALGIYVLQMLLTVPFSTTGLSLRHMLDFSRNIVSNYSYTLSQLEEDNVLYSLVIRMLSSDPSQRPNPKQIIYAL